MYAPNIIVQHFRNHPAVAEANFSYPARGATEILYMKISVTVIVNTSVFIQGWQNYKVLDYQKKAPKHHGQLYTVT